MRAPLSVLCAALLGTCWAGASAARLVAAAAQTAPAAADQAGPALRSVWAGVYSEAQAARGRALYHDNCERCHGVALEGSVEANTHSLAGSEFLKSRDGSTLGALYHRILTGMPDDDPGTMRPAEVADLVAFILGANKIPAGPAELPADADALKLIRIDAVKPK